MINGRDNAYRLLAWSGAQAGPSGVAPAASPTPSVNDAYQSAMNSMDAELNALRQQMQQRPTTAPQKTTPRPPGINAHAPHYAKPPVQPPSSSSAGPAAGTQIKEGHRLPASHGRATTFWNGHYLYKGTRDHGNMGRGAWGDANKPTDYFCALPVGLSGGGGWWHNQKILITNPTTGKQVCVRVQDKGPGPRTGNAVDLSPVAKEALGVRYDDNMNVHIAFADPGLPVGPVT